MQAATPPVGQDGRSRRFGLFRPLVKLGIRAAFDTYEFIRGGALDLAEALAGKRRPLTPPRRLWPLVTGRSNDFHQSGEDLRGFLIGKGLQPGHRVLDVGCGIGRLAVPLTAYLDATGGYEGFDIMPQAIRWCRRVTQTYPNFRFQLADVHSDRYYPRGRTRADSYVFPYPSDSFDFVVLGSVFSHMLPADLSNYLSEIARVLRPGGRAVISCYLLSEAKRAAVKTGGGGFSFSHPGPGYWAEFAALPEAAIAYQEDWMFALYAQNRLTVDEYIPGLWSTQPVQSQDMIIATKQVR
jgi:SAM-dependent methyltransferase